MKFISCHIENFGKLSDFSFEFSEGTNVICEKNGWGKSTFAAFIRAMFYGLEGGRKRN
ncbi:MAG: AAA family ATPase, partial [Lachnospiraceae bacterium]|nr:AAA family ATPase [Lachnospiraceae bacterium]